MEWISVKDKLPGKNQKILVKNENLQCRAIFLEWEEGATGYYFCCDESGIDSNQKWTYWKPIEENGS